MLHVLLLILSWLLFCASVLKEKLRERRPVVHPPPFHAIAFSRRHTLS